VPHRSKLVYVAETASCTFHLDGDGICRRIVPNPALGAGMREAGRQAARCVGAQYVASLDASITGMLADRPRVGTSMLFARVDGRGRVSLVRTGVVTGFGEHREEDPFFDDKARTVETSAPQIEPGARVAPPSPAIMRRPAAEPEPLELDDLIEEEDDFARTSEYAAAPPRRSEPQLARSPARPTGYERPVGYDRAHDARLARGRRTR
jgi:hypothetical protein